MDSHTSFLIGPIILAVLSIPLILNVVPPNRIYGFRTPKTLASEALWYRANSFAGWVFLIAAVISIGLLQAMRIGVLPVVSPGIIAVVLPVLLAVAACFVYLRRITGNPEGERK